MSKIYHNIIFEQNDFLKNQVIEELLRERANYYISKSRQQDFWILINPKITKSLEFIEKLKETQYWKKNKKVKNKKDITSYAFLSSTDIEFIKWIKLRIGYFEDIDNPLLKEDFKSNGVYFPLCFENEKLLYSFNSSLLNHNSLAISSDILLEQLESVVVN